MLTEKGYLECINLLRPKANAKTVRMVRLAEETNLENSPSLTAKQREVVRVISEAGSAAEKEAAYHAGVGEGVIRTLVRKGVLEYFEREIFRRPSGKIKAEFSLKDLVLSGEQCLQPPFCDLAMIGFSGLAEDAVRRSAETFHQLLREKILASNNQIPIVLLGVSQAGIYRVNNKFRYRILIKCRNNKRFRQLLRETFSEAVRQNLFGRITVFVDINGEIL